jgi:hypothetical protein
LEIISSYRHEVASHCETGTIRNVLRHAGLEVSEPMIFGIGSGPAFYYLFFAKGPSGFPLIGIRNPPGAILKNLKKRCGIGFEVEKPRTTAAAMERADGLIDGGVPVAISVDMFYMEYLPAFLHVHAPFHFIALIGRGEEGYAVSDPYFEPVGTLDRSSLRAAWATHAPMAEDNLLAFVEQLPAEIDWRKVSLEAMRKTCDGMILPPVVRSVFFFVGVTGMRTYARKMLDWPRRHRGSFLREGILFNAVGFEDQGTGGGAFRLMYGAFLQEVAGITGSRALEEKSEEMLEHGRAWRDISRKIIKLGKAVPVYDEEFDDWFVEGERFLDEGLAEVSARFLERADFEQRFFTELKRLVGELS